MQDLPDIGLPLAPSWSLLTGSIGRFLVYLAVFSFLLAVLSSLRGGQRSKRVAKTGFVIGCLSLFGTFLTLAVLFAKDRFEFLYVYQHAQTDNALAYKIAGIWSGQQGSFLLWAVCGGIFCWAALRSVGPYQRPFILTASCFLGSIAGILSYETPFSLQLTHGKAFVPPDGVGLAPSLQNYWVVIHPPTIFLGFGSLAVLFAFAVSALATRNYEDWVPRVRPWAIVSTTLVGLGLCMGGFWAYETLGWGGFWKWDPVENVSFVPWCLTVALIHGLIVQVTRKKWHFSNLMLSGMAFLVFVYGTFLTRAGFLDGVSVHSFAKMDRTAHKVLLTFFFASTGGFIILWATRWFKDRRSATAAPIIDRERAYQAGNVLIVLLGLATGIGMSVPLFQYLAGKPPKVVEEHVYHEVLVWMVVPILLLMAVAPFVAWRKMSLRELLGRIVNVFSVTLGVVGISVLIMKSPGMGINHDPREVIHTPFGNWPTFPWIGFLFALCVFTAIGNLFRLVDVWKRNRSSAGAFLSHLGLAVALAGLIVSRGLERKQEVFVQKDRPVGALEYFLSYRKMTGDLFDRKNKVEFDVSGRGRNFVARPGLYYLPSTTEVRPMVWPHIERGLSHDLYFTLHPPVFEAGDPLTLKPGETKTFEILQFAENRVIPYKISFKKLNRVGEAGATGTKFVAELDIVTDEGKKLTAAPAMILQKGGVEQPPDVISNDYFIRLEKMDAADKSVTIQMGFTEPVYPVELYYKPLTGLVWLGTGILSLGGFLSAWSRRMRRKSPSDNVEGGETLQDHATQSVA